MNKNKLIPLLLIAGAAGLTAALPAPAPNAAAAAAASPQQAVVRSGTVAGWAVDASGTVALELTGEHDGQSFALWFATPPNRTSTTGFEKMVLDALLVKASVAVVSETSEGADGSSIERALPLLSLRSR